MNCRSGLFLQVKLFSKEEVYNAPHLQEILQLFYFKPNIFICAFTKWGWGCPVELLWGKKLNQMMDKFTKFCFPNVRSFFSSLKNHMRSQGYLSNILARKYRSGYNYIQDNCFLGQQFFLKHVFFKMSTHRYVSGLDLVLWIQVGRNLQTYWVMFSCKMTQWMDDLGLPCVWLWFELL